MSTPATEADLATGVAASLTRSGIPAAAQVDAGTAWLALALEGDASTVAYLDVADLTHAVTSDARGQRLIPVGPLAPGEERCDDASCVSA